MLTRDISLEQAVLDLVDNCVDGAKRLAAAGGEFGNHSVELVITGTVFSITDNCGGFSREDAINYAFRFGRPQGTPRTPSSIGQFGVGMKRALFKFGEHFVVRSATTADEWAVALDVPIWLERGDWHFPWVAFGERETISTTKPGTQIIVDRLRPDVAARFATTNFSNLVVDLIKSKHRQFISQGLSISVNGRHIDASDLYLSFNEQLKPGRDDFVIEEPGKLAVFIKITVGVGASIPREAGWYVICNGRVVLSADRRDITGWGLLENESDRLMVPNFHNQYARFRGIVWFDSEDSSRVPWNTTKTDVDVDSSVWQRAFSRMIEMMRPVITFLNDLDQDIDANTRESSPLYQYVTQAPTVKAERVTGKSDFVAPSRSSVQFKPKTVKIQYSRRIEDVDYLKDALDLGSARAVGEKTFDMILESQRSE
ncbi:hypothetical protein X732_19245 [Mesorhizobium sp. L2C066B000]|nr:hypothetical protein X732_19245 [Mesorhizobium sp. L2C066B000]